MLKRNSRQGLLSLFLASALAAGASAQTYPHADTAFIDPNGLELDGAGAVESAVSLETTDLTLLMIWIAFTAGMAGVAMADRRYANRSSIDAGVRILDPTTAHGLVDAHDTHVKVGALHGPV
jgi:hypothetical protein